MTVDGFPKYKASSNQGIPAVFNHHTMIEQTTIKTSPKLQSFLGNSIEMINEIRDENKHRSQNWHIPRPSLISSSSVSSEHNGNSRRPSDQQVSTTNNLYGYNSSPRGSTSSSNNSTQSARSGSLLLTVANLAKIDQEHNRNLTSTQLKNNQANMSMNNIQYYLEQQRPTNEIMDPTKTNSTICQNGKDNLDCISIASSTHFTVVNGFGNARHKNRANNLSNSCCHKHRLTVLTLTMSSIFMFGIIVAVYLFEMRAMHLRNS